MLTGPYPTGGKNEKEEIASLVVAFVYIRLRGMRNSSRHGGRYTEHRESREKDSLWRIGLHSLLLETTFIQYRVIGKSLSGGRKQIQKKNPRVCRTRDLYKALSQHRSYQLSDRSQRLHCHGSDDGSSRTVAVPVCVISKAFAAASDKSMIRLSIKGPRSLIFTSTDFPLARFVTFIFVPNGRVGCAAVNSA
jgi:hypothetical protein